MRRSLITALLILLAAAVMAHGATPLDDAKKSVAAADKKVASNAATLQTLARTLAQHLAALADVAKELGAIQDRQKQAAPIIAKALGAVNADLVTAKADAAAAERALREAEAALTAARAGVGPKRAAIERAASEERRAFEASDQFKQASAKVEAANEALAKERSRLDAAMKDDDAAADLIGQEFVARLQLRRAQQTSPIDHAAIAEANGRWLETKNALSAAQAKIYDADPAFVAAQKAAASAAAARHALSDAFDKSILGQPSVAEAQVAFHDTQSAVKVAEANVAAARDALERAGRWQISQRETADVIARISKEADAALADAQAGLKRADDAVRGVGQDLTEAAQAVLEIRDDLRVATKAIQAAEKR